MSLKEIEKLREKVEKDPSSKLYVPLAEEYRKEGMLDEAIDVLRKGIETQPGYMSARVSLGKIYLEKGQKDEARIEFENVIKSIPDNLFAHKKLADIYKDTGKKELAIKTIRTLLKLNPMDEDALILLRDLEGGVNKELPEKHSSSDRVPEQSTAKGETPFTLEHTTHDQGVSQSSGKEAIASIFGFEDEKTSEDVPESSIEDDKNTGKSSAGADETGNWSFGEDAFQTENAEEEEELEENSESIASWDFGKMEEPVTTGASDSEKTAVDWSFGDVSGMPEGDGPQEDALEIEEDSGSLGDWSFGEIADTTGKEDRVSDDLKTENPEAEEWSFAEPGDLPSSEDEKDNPKESSEDKEGWSFGESEVLQAGGTAGSDQEAATGWTFGEEAVSEEVKTDDTGEFKSSESIADWGFGNLETETEKTTGTGDAEPWAFESGTQSGTADLEPPLSEEVEATGDWSFSEVEAGPADLLPQEEKTEVVDFASFAEDESSSARVEYPAEKISEPVEIDNIVGKTALSSRSDISDVGTELLKTADRFVAEGNYSGALGLYQQILASVPGDRRTVQRIEELRHLLKLLGKDKDVLIAKLSAFQSAIEKRGNEFYRSS